MRGYYQRPDLTDVTSPFRLGSLAEVLGGHLGQVRERRSKSTAPSGLNVIRPVEQQTRRDVEKIVLGLTPPAHAA